VIPNSADRSCEAVNHQSFDSKLLDLHLETLGSAPREAGVCASASRRTRTLPFPPHAFKSHTYDMHAKNYVRPYLNPTAILPRGSYHCASAGGQSTRLEAPDPLSNTSDCMQSLAYCANPARLVRNSSCYYDCERTEEEHAILWLAHWLGTSVYRKGKAWPQQQKRRTRARGTVYRYAGEMSLSQEVAVHLGESA
jgi:hypothetical protein